MDDSIELSAVWERAKTRLDATELRPQQRAWIGLTRLIGLVQDTALLAAPTDFAKEYIERQMRPVLTSALSAELEREIQVAVTVDTSAEHREHVAPDLQPGAATESAPGLGGANGTASGASDGGGWSGPLTGGWGDTDSGWAEPDTGGWSTPVGPGYRGRPGDSGQDPDGAVNGHAERVDGYAARFGRSGGELISARDRDARLNPKYTFETFVIGSSNRFTHAAAVAVAEAPAKAYNPLFVYGDSGLGKTHLLHAIGHYAQRLFPGLRTRYVSSEEFTNDFINSLRDDKMQAFQGRYRSVDLLLIDDIQFLERAERTQEEFFHTFNTLHNANKQIVISSDRTPRQLSTLEDRLRTRFEWGLISDVQAPDLETRIAILRKKAAQEGMNPPPEVLEFIATRVQSNIRELEGALIRVTAFASLNKQQVELGLAETVLKDLISNAESPEITAALIMGVAAEFFGISMDDITGQSRSRVLVQARQIAMYLCRELTELSLPRIGQAFGGRDHTTVMHAEKKVRGLMNERLQVFNQVQELTARIKTRSRAS